jgi:RNA polymerase sigma-70 factor (ECF subfamily)
LEFYLFDANYVQRLKDGDLATEEHFATYFNELLYLKLRTRPLSRDSIDDIRQDTLMRVLIAVRKKGMRQPERLGAFVNAFCDRILKEFYRRHSRHDPMDEQVEEPADPGADPDEALITFETCQMVHGVLNQLPVRERDILRAVYIRELDHDEMQRRYQKTPTYVRVRVHRAKKGFRKVYLAIFPHPPLALRTLGDLARSGNPAAQTQLAIWYLEGKRVEADHGKAFRLLSNAVSRHFAPAQFHLGCMHERGLGIPVNLAEAVRFYTSAAEQGEFFAQVALGRVYAHGGHGMPADCCAAKHWYTAAADQEEIYQGCEELREAKAYLRGVKGAEA